MHHPLASIFDTVVTELRAAEASCQACVLPIAPLAPYVEEEADDCRRLRAAIVLIAARVAGGSDERTQLYASVVELINLATRIHISQIAAQRADWNHSLVASNDRNAVAVLVGDYLYVRS